MGFSELTVSIPLPDDDFTLATTRLPGSTATRSRPPISPLAISTRTGLHTPPGGAFGGAGVPRGSTPAEQREANQKPGPGAYDDRDDFSVLTERTPSFKIISSREAESRRQPRSLSPGPLPPSPRLLQDGFQLASTLSTHGSQNSVIKAFSLRTSEETGRDPAGTAPRSFLPAGPGAYHNELKNDATSTTVKSRTDTEGQFLGPGFEVARAASPTSDFAR